MQIEQYKNIDWSLLILLCLIIVGISNSAFFLLSIFYFFLFVIIKHRGQFQIPNVPGLKCYLFFVLYATMIGLCLYSFRNVARDLFYILPAVLWVFIGCNFCQVNGDEKSLLKTLYLFGGINSIYCIIQFIIQHTFNFSSMRSIFGANVYEIGFILPIMTFKVLIAKQCAFSKRIDNFLILCMLLQIVLSFGRIAILEPILGFLVLSILSVLRLENRGSALKAVTGITFILCVAVVCIFFVMPDDLTTTFMNKVWKSATEINASQDIDSVNSAMQNWRAYEMQAAAKEWKQVGILSQLFGEGIGKGITLQYVPYNWKGVLDGHEMPLAHNGFYTLLPKGGLFAVFSLLWIFIGSTVHGWKMAKFCQNNLQQYGMILVAVMVAGFANTWVVRGPVSSQAFVVWGILLGYISALERNSLEWENL